jgi:hypothetical protein
MLVLLSSLILAVLSAMTLGKTHGAPRSVRMIKDDKRWFAREGDFLVRELGAPGRRAPASEAGECPHVVWCSLCTQRAVVCGVGAERAFDDLEPTEVVLVPNLRPIEQMRKARGDVGAGRKQFP